jgi:cell division protein FtsQ
VREQAIPHKVGNRSGIGGQRRSSGTAQRPARRETGSEPLATRLRAMLGFVPAFMKLVLALVVLGLVFVGYRAAASASFFQVRKVEVQGASRVSADDVQAIVRKEVEKTGVWRADLKGLNAKLERLPWVRTAVVSRVLPDGIRVRITERVPLAVVRTASGKFRWVDVDAVLLGEMQPTDQLPPFFLRGLTEDDPDGARADNRERVAKFLELQQAWDAAGLSERVSEVNLIDIRDVRAQLAGDYSRIEVRLGAQDHGKRLQDALKVLDSQAQTANGERISYIDLSQGRRAIVGLTSGAQATTDGAADSTPADDTIGEQRPDRNSSTVAVGERVSADGPGAVTRTDRSTRPAAAEQRPQPRSDQPNNTNRRRQ